jgi:GNAT superfamily N-acetyltransferase
MTSSDSFQIRPATIEDVPLILRFIRQLADFEGLSDEVVATEDDLRRTLFEEEGAEVIIGQWEGRLVGFALFFSNYSTFLGKPGIYLEDLYVIPSMRERGCGKAMLGYLAQLAITRGCGRLEWWCLDENTPGIEFYRSLGAEAMEDWTVHRLSGDALKRVADQQ